MSLVVRGVGRVGVVRPGGGDVSLERLVADGGGWKGGECLMMI